MCEPLIRDDRLRKLTFTGSTAVGKMLVEQSAEQLLRVSMELGGNAPFLVFEDADVDRAVDGAMLAKMRNIGEACTAANRFFVHESLAEEFSTKLAGRMGALVVGKGTKKGVDVGPLITPKARERVDELVQDAVDRGARLLTGGGAARPGNFYEPTVLADVPADSRCLSEEIFGPVAPVATFTDDADAVAKANGTEYGLVGYVYTDDQARMLRVARRWSSGWSASTPASCPTRRHRSGVSSSPASAGRAASRASTSTSRPSTSASRCDLRRRRARVPDLPNPSHGCAHGWWTVLHEHEH